MASEGNHQAYAQLHKGLYPCLFQYLLGMIKDEEIVDDLLQDLFVKLWQKRTTIGAVNNVKAYFFTAARSMAMNHFRLIKSRNLKLENFEQPEIDFSAEEIIVVAENNSQLKAMMANALNALPARQREVVYLRFYEELEYQKIADVTGIQYQSVVNHVFRALQTLRAEFAHLKLENVLVV